MTQRPLYYTCVHTVVTSWESGTTVVFSMSLQLKPRILHFGIWIMTRCISAALVIALSSQLARGWQTNRQSPPRRRFYLWSSIFDPASRRAILKRDAIAAVKYMGGSLTLDEKKPGRPALTCFHFRQITQGETLRPK